jgi:hypothetical protein
LASGTATEVFLSTIKQPPTVKTRPVNEPERVSQLDGRLYHVFDCYVLGLHDLQPLTVAFPLQKRANQFNSPNLLLKLHARLIFTPIRPVEQGTNLRDLFRKDSATPYKYGTYCHRAVSKNSPRSNTNRRLQDDDDSLYRSAKQNGYTKASNRIWNRTGRFWCIMVDTGPDFDSYDLHLMHFPRRQITMNGQINVFARLAMTKNKLSKIKSSNPTHALQA